MIPLEIHHVPASETTAAESAEPLAACHEIRRVVFVEEQQVDEALEWDGLDDRADHFLAVAHDDRRPVGTARLRIVEGEAKAERVAVLANARVGGVGRVLMQAVEERAGALGCQRIVLHAQVEALPFYERLGYEAEGPVYPEAGIPHRTMRKTLAIPATGAR